MQYDGGSECEPERAEPRSDWVVSCSIPPWATHFVRVLLRHGLLRYMGMQPQVRFSTWVDCSGINSEMFALRELGKQLRALVGVSVKWILYCTCDSDKMSRRCSELNHDPMHVSNKMEHRNFGASQIYCEKHDTNHDPLNRSEKTRGRPAKNDGKNTHTSRRTTKSEITAKNLLAGAICPWSVFASKGQAWFIHFVR